MKTATAVAAVDAGLTAWLRLTLTPGIGGETQRTLLAAFGLPEAIFASGMGALHKVIGAAQAGRLLQADAEIEARIDSALAWATEPGNHILTLADAEYPQALLRSADPPVLLYVKGRRELLNRQALAIVGSRNATPQGQINAEAFAHTFAAAGLTVVSGMALGIDTRAHHGALAAGAHGASTIAVIGTGAARVYPAGNRDLARQIAEHGAIVSEFPLDTPALAGNFPRRNRIIAGLALGTLVIEAAERSGSLITARLASEAGREVFAIPGSIHSPLAKGCHQLIKQGAKLVESAQDVLEELRWQTAVTSPATRHGEAAASLDANDECVERVLTALGFDPCALDTLSERSGLTSDALLAILLQLELDGRVSSMPGSRYQRLQK